MATLSKEDILDAIANMSVLEVSELVKSMEEKFGVTAAAPVAVAAAGGAPAGDGGGDAAEEQSEFNVVLTGFADGKKIPVIKEVRAITGLGLKEAKELVEEGGKTIKEGVSKDEANTLKTKLEEAGGTVELQ